MKLTSAAMTVALLTCTSLVNAAIPYQDKHYQFTQPDGETITLILNGNNYFAQQRTVGGKLVVYDDALRGMAYAQLSADGEALISTGVLVSNRAKQGVKVRQLEDYQQGLSSAIIAKKVKAAQQSMLGLLSHDLAHRRHEEHKTELTQLNTSITGKVKGLTIIIDFPDERGTITKAQIERFLNDENYSEFGNAQSVRGYFTSVSGGKLDYTNTVTAYYTAKNNKAYYADSSLSSTVRSQELIKEALNWLEFNQGFDFRSLTTNSSGQIRGLNIFYAGNSDSAWSKGLWPHMARLSPRFCADGVCTDRYQITDMGDSLAIGTFVHESGHLITNWPDLYDYDGSSEGSVASFGVMGFGAIGTSNRFEPTPPVAHFRALAGWDNVIELNPALNSNAPSGQLSHISGSNTSYKWSNPNNTNETFYIEAIHQSGQHSQQLDSGLAIWHVDPAGNNSNEWYPYIQMEHGDASRDPENGRNRGDNGDLFNVAGEFSATLPNALAQRGTNALWWNGDDSGLRISNISDPAAEIRFTVSATLPPPPKGDIYRGYLADKEQAIQPNGRWFQYNGGVIDAVLLGPESADFDLKLEAWKNGQWQQVAISETPSSQETIRYTASAGYYRIIIYSYRGAGDYRLTIQK
ncbi:M6 family metalloprotease domain-containing protein [Pseudoalteromonas sp. J010]|uniref:M6 family metalloprotease domain-containing protein n=1 Tax=Pseudoalteromonas sp. J010 TaxID=998465 RepID=UPI000F64E078|nr:M6 family metalloprotease domain-containing protein [Pseudoalteromonas sp. J010]RRS09215.1 M6 family metalloprotease domain-containing protein [Pseudoalteromonas sp. J010]